MNTNGSVDPFDGSKSRKSSGFSDGTNGGGSKSRQYSGYELQNKSRNCSGNSISAGLVSSGNILCLMVYFVCINIKLWKVLFAK